MRPNDTKAAKRPKIASSINKLVGSPHDLTAGGEARKTHAQTRPLVNSAIAGMKFMEQPNNYGRGV